MQWLDWIIVFFPLAVLIGLAVYSKRYARSVSDYLVAGRVAGRYVLSVGDMAAGLAVITFVAGCEQYYQTGFAVAFWGAVSTPITLFIALSGYIVYRWRQTRCLSFGQFLEMRYGSKFFRIFCSSLRTVAEMGANAIGPAIAARFFIYYLELPHSFTVCGISCSTYICLVTVCTALSVFFILQGGRISLLITDCFQGILFFPILMLLVAFILCKFSWFQDIAPVLTNRVAHQSFLNPYDISELRDFNVIAIVVFIVGSVLNRGAFIGNDTSGAGRTPHEQKMAGVLGAWRNALSTVALLLLGIIVIVFMNEPRFLGDKGDFRASNTQVRQNLSAQVLSEVVKDPVQREKALREVRGIMLAQEAEKLSRPISNKDNLDTEYYKAVQTGLGVAGGKLPVPAVPFGVSADDDACRPAGNPACRNGRNDLSAHDYADGFNGCRTDFQCKRNPCSGCRSAALQNAHFSGKASADSARDDDACRRPFCGVFLLFHSAGLHFHVHYDYRCSVVRRRGTGCGAWPLFAVRKSYRRLVCDYFRFRDIAAGTDSPAELGAARLSVP